MDFNYYAENTKTSEGGLDDMHGCDIRHAQYNLQRYDKVN